jgi:hypothetical protein
MVRQSELHTSVDIDAAPEAVWATLTDFARYPDWNPFLTRAEGELVEGARLRVRLTPPGGRGMTMTPRLTVVRPARTFEWLGHVGIPGIFDGRHRFELVKTATGTMLIQRETFTGVLARLVLRAIGRRTLAGFVAMNDALKARVEHPSTVAP